MSAVRSVIDRRRIVIIPPGTDGQCLASIPRPVFAIAGAGPIQASARSLVRRTVLVTLPMVICRRLLSADCLQAWARSIGALLTMGLRAKCSPAARSVLQIGRICAPIGLVGSGRGGRAHGSLRMGRWRCRSFTRLVVGQETSGIWSAHDAEAVAGPQAAAPQRLAAGHAELDLGLSVEQAPDAPGPLEIPALRGWATCGTPWSNQAVAA